MEAAAVAAPATERPASSHHRGMATASSSSSEQQTHEIRLMVYDLSDYNNMLGCIGLGIFHTGVCVHGLEYSYGGHDKPASGCFVTRPYAAPPPAKFKEAIVLGRTRRSPREVMEIVALMGSDKFMGNRYHLLEQNCNHFSRALAEVLLNDNAERIAHMPAWINRAASAALCCSCLLPTDSLLPVPPVANDAVAAAERGSGAAAANDEELRRNENLAEDERLRQQREQQQQQQQQQLGSGDDEILLSPGKTKQKAKRSPISAPRYSARRYQIESDS